MAAPPHPPTPASAVKPSPLRQVVASNPDRLGGTPCFKGTRVPVKTLFDYLQDGCSVEEFLSDFDGVTAEQVRIVLAAAAADVLRAVDAA